MKEYTKPSFSLVLITFEESIAQQASPTTCTVYCSGTNIELYESLTGKKVNREPA